jgi:hypothetical protein
MSSAADLRRIALLLEGTNEAPHFDRAAFKVARIYATLAADGLTANLKFTPDEQELKCLVAPEVFTPVPNAWGKQGWTTVCLAKARIPDLSSALEMAWRHALPAGRARRPERASKGVVDRNLAARAANDLARAFELMRAAARELDLPSLEESTRFGRPSLQVRGRSIMGSKDGEALVVFCPLEEKEVLLEAAPEIYFETNHYKGYPAILVRPEKIDKRELKHRIKRAWYVCATKRQIAEYEARNVPNKAAKRAKQKG